MPDPSRRKRVGLWTTGPAESTAAQRLASGPTGGSADADSDGPRGTACVRGPGHPHRHGCTGGRGRGRRHVRPGSAAPRRALLPDPCDRFTVEGHEILDDAVIGEGRLLRGALLRASPSHHRDRPSRRMPLGSGALVELHVVGGPGAGRIVQVRRGDQVLGRAASSDIRLDDLGISRAHAVITADDAGLRFRDLDPTNPSTVDGSPVPPAGSHLPLGSRIHLASTTIVLRRPETTPAAAECTGGTVRINRRPRFLIPTEAETIRFPPAPTRPEGARAPVVAAMAPLVVSVGLATVLRSPVMLLFALMSPVLLLAQWWSDRRHGRVSYRTQLAEHSSETARAEARLSEVLATEGHRRHAQQPDLPTAASVVSSRDARVWGAAPGRPRPPGPACRHRRPARRDEGRETRRRERAANHPRSPCRRRPGGRRRDRHRRAPISIPLRSKRSHRPDGDLALAAHHASGRDLDLRHGRVGLGLDQPAATHARRRPRAPGNGGLDSGRDGCGSPPQRARCGHQRAHRATTRWWSGRPSPPPVRRGSRRHRRAPPPG